MTVNKFAAALAAALALSALPAQAQTSCSLPGELLLEDPAGDTGPTTAAGAVPVPVEAADIISLHAAEPDSMAGKLVFTYKIATLAQPVPQLGYILRFATDLPPDNGDEDYFVAMLTAPGGGARFVYGTDGFQFGAPAGEPRQFRIVGDLDPASNFAADGTITLVLDKAAVPGLEAGLFAFNILPTVRVVTPAQAPAPFFTNADNATILDDTLGSGFYEVTGGCGGKSGVLGVGALSPFALLLLLVPALARRRS